MTPYQQSKMDYVVTGKITDPYHAFVEIQKSHVRGDELTGKIISPFIKWLNKKQKIRVNSLIRAQNKLRDLRFSVHRDITARADIILCMFKWSRIMTAAFKEKGVDINVEVLFKSKSIKGLDRVSRGIYSTPEGRRYVVVKLDGPWADRMLFEYTIHKAPKSVKLETRIGIYGDYVDLPYDLSIYPSTNGTDIESIIKQGRDLWLSEYKKALLTHSQSSISQSSVIRQIASMRSTTFNRKNYSERIAIQSLKLLTKKNVREY